MNTDLKITEPITLDLVRIFKSIKIQQLITAMNINIYEYITEFKLLTIFKYA